MNQKSGFLSSFCFACPYKSHGLKYFPELQTLDYLIFFYLVCNKLPFTLKKNVIRKAPHSVDTCIVGPQNATCFDRHVCKHMMNAFVALCGYLSPPSHTYIFISISECQALRKKREKICPLTPSGS